MAKDVQETLIQIIRKEGNKRKKMQRIFKRIPKTKTLSAGCLLRRKSNVTNKIVLPPPAGKT